MQGKVALVTGATSGIGRATAVAFARRGARVVVCGRREAEGRQTVEALRAVGSDGFFMAVDVSDEAAVEALVAATVERYGRLDYAFNNAGYGDAPGPLHSIARKDWDRMIAVHLTGTWACMKYELQQMLPQGGGVIVNMASVAGVIGAVGLSSYVAVKHGIMGLTKTAAVEYAPFGIRINVVGPGGVVTEGLEGLLAMPAVAAHFTQTHPVNRLGRPEEVANAVVWLCSDEASFMTGAAMMIDGGVTAGLNPFGLAAG